MTSATWRASQHISAEVNSVTAIVIRLAQRSRTQHVLAGASNVQLEDPMPAYEICYKDDSGNLARAFSVKFDSELRAKILAHALKPQECRQLEVWDGDRLIYSRPEQIADA
jgi:hypothetical protein